MTQPLRVLFGVSDGDYYARQFARVAAVMPDAVCRFVGLSWSAGRDMRRRGLAYAHLPWRRTAAVATGAVPAVAEFSSSGFTPDALPQKLLDTWAAASALVEEEIESFSPQIVVHGPAEHAIAWLVGRSAVARKIATLGLQPCHLKEHFIAHSQGERWQQHLSRVALPEEPAAGVGNESPPTAPIRSQPARRRNPLRWSNWERGVEYTVRALSGRNGFHTMGSLSSWVVSRLAPRVWFPDCDTLASLEECGPRYVVVALHQPCLPSTCPTWVDLLRFALEATPDGFLIVIRPHPVESGRPVPEDLGRALRARGMRVSRAGRGPTMKVLLQRAAAVLTLTSAAGFEALLAGVPVFTLGPAFYQREGLARPTTTQDGARVRAMLADGGQGRPDTALVSRFVSWLSRECIVPAPDVDPREGQALADRIRSVAAQPGGV